MRGWVYMLIDPNGKMYVGRTTDFDRRMRQYTQPSRSNDSAIYRAITLYGFDAFEKRILETIDGDSEYINRELNRIEAEYIRKFDTVNKGYNTYAKDSHGRSVHFSESTRQKMSQSQTGRKHSEESIAKRAGANAYQSKKVRSDMLCKTFDSLMEAANYVGISGGCKISECIKGERKSAGTDPITGIRISDWRFV